MGLLKSISNAAHNAVTTTRAVAGEIKAAAQTTAATASTAARDTFERAKSAADALVTLRGGPGGLTATAQLGAARLASFSVGPTGLKYSDPLSSFGVGGGEIGGSTRLAGPRVGAHATPSGPVATLGAVDVEIADREAEIGLVPSAPQPLLMPTYSGQRRHHTDD